MERDVFTPPRWGLPNVLSTPQRAEIDGPEDWGKVADLERGKHGDRLVWIARRSVSGSDDGPLNYEYNVIVRL